MSFSREKLKSIADTTLAAISSGRVVVNQLVYPLAPNITESTEHTAYYAPNSLLSTWETNSPALPPPSRPFTVIEILETTTLDAARSAGTSGRKKPIGVLNFASAEQPGGGFINGASAQEESLARSSTLYPSLMTPTAQQFYTLHSADGKDGFYSHAMIYSPRIVIFRLDDGTMAVPMEIDVITSPAVHAGLIRKKAVSGPGHAIEASIIFAMRERMARILFLFERRQVRNIVLGSFGTGVFQNSVEAVAGIWAELLGTPRARFGRSFDYVAFAIVDNDTFSHFKDSFERAAAMSH
ncbi:DUF2263 domain-containing protein [Mycena indigotica]|uniref:DUF2263 domain-containing protein n=1 Tax=Mycena indigotica TaxID=2126181 RepID=A0A8H6VX54_9AGAR|nr:DUF2263 domain-containing protein [Mycena indigotica]KAF7297122.1 DUF2263 domain-containing protein [Mycena indigotica]